MRSKSRALYGEFQAGPTATQPTAGDMKQGRGHTEQDTGPLAQLWACSSVEGCKPNVPNVHTWVALSSSPSADLQNVLPPSYPTSGEHEKTLLHETVTRRFDGRSRHRGSALRMVSHPRNSTGHNFTTSTHNQPGAQRPIIAHEMYIGFFLVFKREKLLPQNASEDVDPGHSLCSLRENPSRQVIKSQRLL